MFFKQLASKESSLSYFFGCGTAGRAVAVDVVAGDEDWFVEQAQASGVQITHVIDTHIHADHFSGGRTLAAMVGAQPCLHESASALVGFPFQPLRDGQAIDLGNVQVQVLHTPGHTHESICLLVKDVRRGDAPWFVLTGDTLFVGAVGRPDLAGEEQAMAGALWESLHGKLLSLPADVEIYPGHQAGSACGAGLSGKPSSTLGFEQRWNPTLRQDKAAFVRDVLANTPPRPAGMDRIVAANIAA